MAVPLPVGTDVTTRVDRTVDDQLRPQGAAGRVAAIDGDRIVVAFLDGRTASYLRSELVPRKLGVQRYAQRRAAAWDQLHDCIVLDTVVGSRAWGLADEGSDEDHRGIFVLPLAWTSGLAEPPLDLVSLDGSATYWEVGKAIRQALRADPNTLEMLFADPQVRDPMIEPVVAMRRGFVSQAIYGSFGRYALSQLDRLEHNQRLSDHRTKVIDWLRSDPTLELDAAAVRLADEVRIAAPTRDDAIARAKEYLKQLYRSLYDQGVIASNEWSALRTASFVDTPARDLRPKNAYNLIRLLDLATRWLAGEPPTTRCSDQLRPTLLAIKRGELPITEVMELARTLTPQLEAARQTSPLPRHPDVAAAERALRAIRAEVARRAIERVDDPWGSRAPAPPVARIDE